MTRGHLYNYWRMTFGEITGEEKWYRVNKWKSKSDQLNEQKWQLVSRHQCWFASCLLHNTTLPSNRPVQLPHSAEHYHSEFTTQCWILPQWTYHTVLNITTVNLLHSAVCAAGHTQQSFVTNRSTPPSAATALYQAALSHWFPCFRTTFPTDFIFSIFQIQLSTDFQDGHQAEQEDGGHLKHPQEGWSSSKGEWPDFVLTGKQTHVAPLLTGEQT